VAGVAAADDLVSAPCSARHIRTRRSRVRRTPSASSG
jgi:hypothetical protein